MVEQGAVSAAETPSPVVSPLAQVVIEPCEGRFLSANAAALARLGATAHAALQAKSFFDFLLPAEREHTRGRLQAANPGDSSVVFGQLQLQVPKTIGVPTEVTGQAVLHEGRPTWRLTLAPVTGGDFDAIHQQAIQEHAPFGGHFYHLEPDGQLIFDGANPAADRILGICHAPLVGKTIEAAFPALVGTGIPDTYKRIAREGGTDHRDEVEYHDQNIQGAFEVHAFQTRPGCMAVFFADITKRKQAEASLRASEGRYRALVDNLPQKIFLKDRELVFASCNRHFAADLGMHPDQIVGRTDFDLCPPDVARQYQAEDRAVLAAGAAREFEHRDWVDGKLRITHTVKTPVFDEQGQVAGVLGISWDVTEHWQAEQMLKEREQHFRSLIEQSSDLISIIREDGVITYVGPSSERLLGYRPEELTECNMMEFIHPDDQVLAAAALRRAMEQPRQVQAVILRWRHREGAWRVIEAVGRMLTVDAGGRLTVVVNARDITDRTQAAEELRKSQASLATAQRMAHLGSWELELVSLTDFDQNPLRWSDETYRIFGYEPGAVAVTRALFKQAVHPEDRSRVQAEVERAFRERQPYEVEHRILRPDGNVRVVYEHAEIACDPNTGRPLRLVGTVQDITERKQLETQLRQAQKMEAIGQLAGGVAHDFNNLLTVIQGNAGLLRGERGLSVEASEWVRQIAVSAERAANLTRQLLAFSRQQMMQMRTLDVNDVLEQISKMLRRLLGEHIVLQCQYAANLAPVQADATMLEQVILNLAINARDAMPAGGRLAISTRNQTVGPDHARRNPEAREGAFVVLTVADTGTGIKPADLARIFEPFFTTKEVGKGTGLGLATVYGIVKQHKGWVEISSQPGQGATFNVFLPASESREEAPVAEPPSPAAPAAGHETILVVEDEDLVRHLILSCLRRCGYTVLEAASGPEALALAANYSGSIDLLLTDMVMPGGMSGGELAAQLRRQHPTLKVILSSGYNRDMLNSDQPAAANEFFLSKPYTPAVLTSLVRDCLDHHAPS